LSPKVLTSKRNLSEVIISLDTLLDNVSEVIVMQKQIIRDQKRYATEMERLSNQLEEDRRSYRQQQQQHQQRYQPKVPRGRSKFRGGGRYFDMDPGQA